MSSPVVRVEILSTPACPGRRAARNAVAHPACEEDIEIEIVERVVTSPQTARALRFAGSPTVRIDGRDVDAQSAGPLDFGLG